jgi:hypothetical protein
MTAIANRRHLLESANAYARARQPTPQQVLDLCTAVCQTLADDCGEAVSMVLPGKIVISREPK